MFPVNPVYSFVYTGPKTGKEKGTRDVASPLSIGSSGGRIRTSDLRVMSVISSKSELFVKSVTYGHRAVYDDAPRSTRVTYLPCFSIGSVRAVYAPTKKVLSISP